MTSKYSSRRLLGGRTDDVDMPTRATSPARPSLADRLKTTAARYDSSSLPDRHSRHRSGGLRGSDNDLPSRFAAPLDDRKTDEKDYKKLFEDSREDNERLQRELEDAKRRVAELESRLERVDDVSARRKAAETEKRALERKLAEAEKELMNSPNVETLRAKNIELAQENQALTRLVSKLGGGDGGDDKPTRSLVDTFSVAGGDTEPKSKPINDDVERKTSDDLPRRSSYTKYGSDTLSSVSSSRDQSPSYRSGYGDSGRRGLSKSSSSTLDNASYTTRPSSAYRSLKDKHSSAYSKFTTPTSYSALSSRSHYSSITPSSPLSTRSKLTTSKSYTKPDTYTSYRNRNFDSLSKSRSSNFPTSANSKRVGTLLDTYRGASIKP